MTRIAIFASGAGSNALKLIEKFSQHPSGFIALVVCNKPGAGVIQIATQHGIEVLMIDKDTFFHSDACLRALTDRRIDYIVLAGFLWKLPPVLVAAYPGRIINIHPALLPRYGGKGMYGLRVHEAVLAAGDSTTGITIHFVDEHYDHGDIIFQDTVSVGENDTPESLAKKIHELEHKHLPNVVEQVIDLQNQR